MIDKNLIKKFETIPFVIGYDNINKFVINPSRRQLNDSHIQAIHGAILDGENPIGILIVNKKDKELRLIDGNHRIEAIKRFYNYKELHKSISIECVLKVYEGLNDEEEREVYANEAKRKNESYEDRLCIYKDTIQFWKLLNDEINRFPCKVSIYHSTKSIRFRTILNAFASMKNSQDKGYFEPIFLKKESLIEFAKSLNYEDFILLKNFIEFFQNTFGLIDSSNIFIKSQLFYPLFDIYCKNINLSSDSSFKERFERIINRSDLKSYALLANKEAQKKIRVIMIDYINKGYSKKFFI